MDGSSMPPSNRMEANDPMKAFIIVILLFLAILLIASTSLANVDLTPGTPPVVTNLESEPLAQDVITINNGAVPAAQVSNANLVPVTGTCINPYTVQPGDILSGIAEICNTTVASIRLANPLITNPNLIYPGQQMVIPDLAQTNAAVINQPAILPTAPAAIVAPAADPAAKLAIQPTVAPQVPISGAAPLIQSGTRLRVMALGYPANTIVNIAVGPQTVGYNIVATGQTDAAGSLTTTIIVPSPPDSVTLWVVVVATSGTPSIQAMSKPFYINSVR